MTQKGHLTKISLASRQEEPGESFPLVQLISRFSPMASAPNAKQGITIDVAYRYFSDGKAEVSSLLTPPGHETVTRATWPRGASTAKPCRDPSGRQQRSAFHKPAVILTLQPCFGIPNVLAAINKMDLIGYQEASLSFCACRMTFSLLCRAAENSSRAVACRSAGARRGQRRYPEP